MIVSYYLRRNELEGIDIVSFYQTLKAIGYIVKIGGNGILIGATLDRYDSREHLLKEIILDVEALLKRFRIKK